MGAVLFEVQLRDLAMGSRRVMVDINESAEDLANSSASKFASHVPLEGETVSLVPDVEDVWHSPRSFRRNARVGRVCQRDLSRCCFS